MKFEVKVEEFLRNVTDVDNRIMQATRLYAETSAAQMEAYAKQNAPWRDITGISRQTISHDVKSDRYKQTIILRGGVSSHFTVQISHIVNVLVSLGIQWVNITHMVIVQFTRH